LPHQRERQCYSANRYCSASTSHEQDAGPTEKKNILHRVCPQSTRILQLGKKILTVIMMFDFSLTVFQTEGSSGKKGSNDVQPGSGNSASPGAQIFLSPFSSSPLANTAWYPHHSQLEWPEVKSYLVTYTVFEPRMPNSTKLGRGIFRLSRSPTGTCLRSRGIFKLS
jgi:hypothetical protein